MTLGYGRSAPGAARAVPAPEPDVAPAVIEDEFALPVGHTEDHPAPAAVKVRRRRRPQNGGSPMTEEQDF